MKTNYNFKISVPVVLDHFNNDHTSICIDATFFELIIRQSDQSTTHIKNLSGFETDSIYYENTNLTCIAARLLENIILSQLINQDSAVFSIEVIKTKNTAFHYDCPESFFCAAFFAINNAYNNYFDKAELTSLIHQHISEYIPNPKLSIVSALMDGGICFSSGKQTYRYPFMEGLSVLVFNSVQPNLAFSFVNTPISPCELLHCFYNRNLEGMRNNMLIRCADIKNNHYEICANHNALQFNMSRTYLYSVIFKNNIDAETCLIAISNSDTLNQSLHTLNYVGITKS